LRRLKERAFHAGLNCGHCRSRKGESCPDAACCENWILHRFRKWKPNPGRFFPQLSNPGLPLKEANRFVDHLAKDKSQFVRTLAQERLNMTEEGLKKPWASAISGALSTAVGALIPIIPFFFLSG
jgi:VIT family